LLALLSAGEAPAQPRDPANPSCPLSPNWSSIPRMRFTMRRVDGHEVLLAEGVIDDDLIPRLTEALRSFEGDEIWLRSPGGNARVGNEAGILIRTQNLKTRIPAGSGCAASCSFMFLGGILRYVDEGGILAVQMFTSVTDPAAVGREITRGGDRADRLINGIALNAARQSSEDNDYLIRMGISRRLLTDIIYRMPGVGDAEHPAPVRCLTFEEMRRYNLVNSGDRQPPSAPGRP
jgi:hypothetical protein